MAEIDKLLTDYLNYSKDENPRAHFAPKIHRQPVSPKTGCAYSARAGCLNIQNIIVVNKLYLASGKINAGRSFPNL